MISIKSKSEIDKMRQVCSLVGKFYKYIENYIKPGISTYDLDQKALEFIKQNNVIPAQVGYDPGIDGMIPFPSSTCISVNDCIIHGIPSKDIILKQGDLVSIDTVFLKDGFHGDAARTFIVGKPNNDLDQKLVDVTKQAFFEGIKYAKPGNRIGDISNAIETYVRKNGFDVIREFTGHGIGRSMHEEPSIPNYGYANKRPRIKEGMTLAIEPMVCQGKRDIYESDDMWAIYMQDGANTAHYENTVLIGKNSVEILTL